MVSKRKCSIFFEGGGSSSVVIGEHLLPLNLFIFGLQSHFKDSKAPQDEAPIHRIRITLTSRNVKSLEKGKVYSQILNVNAKFTMDFRSIWSHHFHLHYYPLY